MPLRDLLGPLRVVLASLALLALPPAAPAAFAQKNCARMSVGQVPLNDLADGTYRGFAGGLYANGEIARPLAHDQGGLLQAARILPRDIEGNPDPNGKVVLLSIGISNATREFSKFQQVLESEPGINQSLVTVDGAQGSQTAAVIANPNAAYWTHVTKSLEQAGVTRAQVQVIWLKEANTFVTQPFPEHALELQSDLTKIAGILHVRFPNARICYFSSRSYGGYATSNLSPEPRAYEEGFAVKWLLEDQIAGNPHLNYDPTLGPVRAPWLAWGPYLWADGNDPRSDGLTWSCEDFEDDGTHPNEVGQAKVARLLIDFFRTDATAKGWFLEAPSPVPAPLAFARKYGTGVAGSRGEVQLVASTLPTVPTATEVRAHAFGGRPGAIGLLTFGTRKHRPGAVPVFGGSLLVSSGKVRTVVIDANGKASVTLGTLPASPTLSGLHLYLQVAVQDPTAPLGISLSRGLHLRTGH